MANDIYKPADGSKRSDDAVLGRASVRKAIERLTGTPLWDKCSKRTLKRLECFLGTERVPEGVDADAFAFYTAQSYLNGAVASMMAHYEDDHDDALARRGKRYIDIALRSAELTESINSTIGGKGPMLYGFEHGFSDAMRTITDYHISDDDTARLLTISIVSALLGLSGTGLLELYTDDDIIGLIDGQSPLTYGRDCVTIVSECIDDDGSVEPMVQEIDRRFGDGHAIAAHIGVPTKRLRDTLVSVIPALRDYIMERVTPTMGVCSDDFVLPAEYATAHAYGMLSAMLLPADDDDDAPFVSDVICDEAQDEMAAFARRASHDAIDDDAIYALLADLAAALGRIGKSLESDDDIDDGRGILGGIVAAYLMPREE